MRIYWWVWKVYLSKADTAEYNRCLSCDELIYAIRTPIYKEPLKTGTTEQRPKGVNIGFTYKDNTINKLIVWNGTMWVNMDGTALQ